VGCSSKKIGNAAINCGGCSSNSKLEMQQLILGDAAIEKGNAAISCGECFSKHLGMQQ